MKPALITAAALAAGLAAALWTHRPSSAAATDRPAVMSRGYYLLAVEVDAAGIPHMGQPVRLDAKTAADLADYLAAVERGGRLAPAGPDEDHPAQADARAGLTAGGYPDQCQAEAISTGRRCRNRAVKDTPYCRVHTRR